MSNKKGIEYKPEKSDDNKEEVKDEPAMILYENPEKKYNYHNIRDFVPL